MRILIETKTKKLRLTIECSFNYNKHMNSCSIVQLVIWTLDSIKIKNNRRIRYETDIYTRRT